MNKLEIVILAAGEGKRMRSRLPKVLHKLAGESLLERVVKTAQSLEPEQIHVVYGHGGECVPEALAHLPVQWVLQVEQKGTGHAVIQAMPKIDDAATVLVLYGDVPLAAKSTLDAVVAKVDGTSLGLLTVELANAKGYGRIVKQENGSVLAIVEERDASPEQRKIREINTGILAVQASTLKGCLNGLGNANAQGEYYLTDCIAAAVADGITVETVHPHSEEEVLGINDCQQLARLERYYQRQQANGLMANGVTLFDPARIDVRGELRCGQDVVIDVNVIFEGRVVLGDAVCIGANTIIRNAEIGAGTVIQANCVIEDAIVGRETRIGPFSRLRPETRLADAVHIGNFVEIKKSVVAQGSKINHLSYIGDSEVGSGVNIGAGTITCNYDGVNKFKTTIGNDSFIGSGTQLVAPVTVGDGATIGAGSTITKDTPKGQLTLARARQQLVKGWQRPKKKL